jgi:hypothetical protein
MRAIKNLMSIMTNQCFTPVKSPKINVWNTCSRREMKMHF